MKTFIAFWGLFWFTLFTHAQTGWFDLHAGITDNEHGQICLTDADHLYVITDHGNFYKTQDGGDTWQSVNIGIDTLFYDIDFIDTQHGAVSGANGSLLTTSDGGNTWQIIQTGTNENLYALDYVNTDKIFCIGDQGSLIYTLNGGQNWHTNSLFSNTELYDIQFKNDLEGYIVGNTKLLKTTDGGITWTDPVSDYNNFPHSPCFSLSITETKIRFVSDGSYKQGFTVYTSNDGGQTYDTEFAVPMCATSLISGVNYLNDHYGFAVINGHSDGILVRLDQGYVSINWISDNAANTVSFNENITYFLDENTIWKTVDGGTNAIKDLSQNLLHIYPNPSSGLIYIDTLFDQAYHITVTDATGRLILKIENIKEKQYPLDMSGYPKGVYIVRIKSEAGIFVKRIQLK